MSAADFRIGNLADDLLCLTLELCGKDTAHTPRFPARFYDSLVKTIIGAALEIHEDVFLANEDREIGYGERRRLKARAEAKCVHLNHLIRVSEERGWISEKQCERWQGLVTNLRWMIYNWQKPK